MKKQQEWAKDLMKAIILLMKDKDYNGDFMTEGYAYTINAVIDNYSQTYYVKGKEKNISLFHQYGKYRDGIYKNILMSNCARKELEDYKKMAEEIDKMRSELIKNINEILDDNKGVSGNKLGNNSYDKTIKDRIDCIIDETNGKYDRLKSDYDAYKNKKQKFREIDLSKKLHGEHMTTQSQTRRILNETLIKIRENPALMDTKEIDEAIEYAFRECKICIITKEESKHLDGEDKRYTEVEIERYIDKVKENVKNLPSRFEDDCKKFIGQKKQSHGFGSIRIQVLMANGVEFVDSEGNKKELPDCLEYLNDGKYEID